MVPRGLCLVELGLLRVRQLLLRALGAFNVQLNLLRYKKKSRPKENSYYVACHVAYAEGARLLTVNSKQG